MDGDFGPASSYLAELTAPAERIQQVQDDDGRIPWFENGPWDPWNHVECAMALTAIGALDGARMAFNHLANTQRPDGAWFGEYGNALPMVDRDFISRERAPAFLDTNFCAYPAVGVFHYLLATRDVPRVREWWPMVKGSMDFVLSLQRTDGAISWAFEALGTGDDDALLAGNASIAKSLECAIRLAESLGEESTGLRAARAALVHALRHRPEVFDRSGKGERFAMDWYYPVLSGALDTRAARQRLDAGWKRFVDPRRGCRCVSDEPWITVAETCELALALIAVGKGARARDLLRTVWNLRNESGAFWMGWQYEERVVWPREAPSWTQAAAILAADALYGDRPRSKLLTSSNL